MKAKWLGVTLLVAVAAACGEGHAIFSIDVYSFMTGTGSDTLRVPPDPLPGLPPASPPVQDSIIPIGVDLPSAMSSSIVDTVRSEEHTSELQSQSNLVCRLLLEKKKKIEIIIGWTRDACSTER